MIEVILRDIECIDLPSKAAALTKREREVYVLAVDVGLTAKQIASYLGIATNTAQKYLGVIYQRFKTNSHQRLIVEHWQWKLGRAVSQN